MFYIEVIVGDEDAGGTAADTSEHEQQMDDSEIKAAFLPIAWAAAYGK